MTSLRKKALLLSSIGFVLGIVVGVCFQLISKPELLSLTGHTLTKILYYLFCGLLGVLGMGGSVIYDIESWSILRCTVTHFLITFGGFVAFYTGLVAIGVSDMPPVGIRIIILVGFVAVYFCIWLIQYLIYRHKVKKMNAKLREWRSRRQ